MAIHTASAALMLVALLSCGPSGTSYTLHKLPSGKEIKLIGIGKIHFSGGEPALALKYETDIPINSQEELLEEVESIWQFFRVDVEKAELRSAIIMANEPPTGFIIKQNQSINFVYKKNNNDQWEHSN